MHPIRQWKRRRRGRGQLIQEAVAADGIGELLEPDAISDLKLWHRSDDIVLSGSDVTQWNDKSGLGSHSTPPGPAPQYGTGGQAGFPFVSFNGVDQYLTGTLTAGGTSFTVTAVLDKQRDAFTECIFGTPFANVGGAAWLGILSGTRQMGGFDGANRPVAAVPNGPQVLTWHWDASVPQLTGYRNGVSLGSTPVDGTRVLGLAFAIARLQYVDNFQFQGNLYDIFLYNRALTGTELGDIHNYACIRYGCI